LRTALSGSFRLFANLTKVFERTAEKKPSSGTKPDAPEIVAITEKELARPAAAHGDSWEPTSSAP
jgi:hypothetical protein